MIASRKSARGLTLIEVLVAVAVMSMISMTIWAATSQTARTRDIVEESHDRLHQVRIAFDMISRDLSSAFLSLHRAPVEPSHDTIFIGQDSGEEDRIDFATFTHQRRYLDVNESDQAEVAYFIAEDPEDGKQLNLVRREAPLLDEEPLEGGQYLIVVEDVAGFDLQYFDFRMNEWQDEWDTTEMTDEAGILPHQVRIRLVVYDRHGEERVYGSQVAIPMRTPIWRKPFIPGP
ncbi:MAG: prepilin-type N-terminal cleavage/methylation domain-containing protein, partial [Deltaproteobacteria bacterium]|nr:prepilin-type N-terminal cleavage/methylation domain-containing protein [Deltaproteobacteria bacterium]